MKALTIEELGQLNTIKIKDEHVTRLLQERVSDCISEINAILSREWHNRSESWYKVPDMPVFGYDAFNIAKVEFAQNGIELTYYQPHRDLSFRII